MILGLDISTSIIGASVLDDDRQVVASVAWDMRNKNHFPDIFSKYNHVRGELLDIHNQYEIDHIFIEQSLQMFRSGFSSAMTLSTLSSFNGLLDREPHFEVEYTKHGNIKPVYYDIADSIVIAKAGYELVKQREIRSS